VVHDTDGACRMSHESDAPGVPSESGDVLPDPDQDEVLVEESDVAPGVRVLEAEEPWSMTVDRR
jgi:hypothetical protein